MEVNWDTGIREFLQKTGAGEPTPGGGSAAAVAAALGAAMTAMSANFSQSEKFEGVRQQMIDAAENADRLAVRCEELLEADMESFMHVVDAYKLPHDTAEDQQFRKAAVSGAAGLAIETPLRLLRVCRDGVRNAFDIAETINANVASDLGIGVLMFDAAAQAACLTVEINLAALRQEEANLYREQASGFIQDIGNYKERTLEVVKRRIAEK
jgi:formiminotetrahydrofolate cyclodeaminase